MAARPRPLGPSEAIEQLSSGAVADFKLFHSIRRHLADSHLTSSDDDWTGRFLKLGGWEHLLDHLQLLSQLPHHSTTSETHRNGNLLRTKLAH